MIKFHCDKCGQKLGVSPEYAGKKVKCTGCGVAHIVPACGDEMESKAYSEGYELGMLPEGAVKSDHKKTKEEIEAVLEKESATLIGHGMIKCPHCGKAVKEGVKLCVNCGEFIHKGGEKHGMGEELAKVAGKMAMGFGAAVMVGGLVAVIAGAIWAGIVILSGYEVGYVAIGIGFLVGLAVTVIAGKQSAQVGTAAAGLAVVGLLVGKLIIMQWGVPSLMAGEFAKMPGMVEIAMAGKMSEEKAFSSRVQTVLNRRAERGDDEERPLPTTIEEQMMAEIGAAASKMGADEKKSLVRRFMVDPMLGEMTIMDRLKDVFSAWDGLWCLLAVTTAFGMGKGKE
ncbi:hypothetical protein KS4_24450 [Poriferisphaera corsica]|uniref:Putative zinc-ribbon domain-containing protein n=1 Tax=Poriferisphaera corsica TaxID=2528020 RepID=A0A517YVY2_9BACT|nr:zinc ribbon domain-containing protein [Poriferisphaera corsica]QDU34377.1 hypothetical protein KS4_24450 [Poriferisphaera corsica]